MLPTCQGHPGAKGHLCCPNEDHCTCKSYTKFTHIKSHWEMISTSIRYLLKMGLICLRKYSDTFQFGASVDREEEGPLPCWNCWRGECCEITEKQPLHPGLNTNILKACTLLIGHGKIGFSWERGSLVNCSSVRSWSRLLDRKRINSCQHIVERNVLGYSLHYFMIWEAEEQLQSIWGKSLHVPTLVWSGFQDALL